jgi:adenosylcobinamide kinase / adenosylcobinamide-phosphate guanylyltransferase
VKELIVGGARSGKSAWAQRRARESGLQVVLIATAVAGDSEMAARIARHRADRPADWLVVEEPQALGDALARHTAPDCCVIVDCLTLWLANLLCPAESAADTTADEAPIPPAFERERSNLLSVVPELSGRIILVSNEIGLGVVPLGAVSRRFCDEAGRLHQDLARLCDRVTMMIAGLPLDVKR